MFPDTIVCQAAVSVSFHWLLGPDSIFLNGILRADLAWEHSVLVTPGIFKSTVV